MELTSGISKRYKRAFVLDEEGLRRFQGILEKAAQELPFSALVVFHLEREDDRYYETTSIEDVLSDPNIPGRRITSLVIELRKETACSPELDRSPEAWRVAVLFSHRERDSPFPDPDMSRIRIATHDKNWALLLADQLEPQVQRTFRPKGTPRWLLALFLVPFLVAAAKYVAQHVVILQNQPPTSAVWMLLILALLLPIAMVLWMTSLIIARSGGPDWMAHRFGPESCFLWGEEAQAYPEREEMRRHIQWGLISAFLVSLAASGAFVAISK